jgi:hypothetical protein
MFERNKVNLGVRAPLRKFKDLRRKDFTYPPRRMTPETVHELYENIFVCTVLHSFGDFP